MTRRFSLAVVTDADADVVSRATVFSEESELVGLRPHLQVDGFHSHPKRQTAIFHTCGVKKVRALVDTFPKVNRKLLK